MNNEQQKIIEIHLIVKLCEANPENTHFPMLNPFNINREQQKRIRIDLIVNMHYHNPKDIHFLMSNPLNTILTPHLQMPGR